MSEKEIEQKLVAAVKAAGGICPKWVAQGMNGMPDRIVLMPEGHMGFVEVKAPGKKPRRIQQRRHLELQYLGYRVYVLDNPQMIPVILQEIQN